MKTLYNIWFIFLILLNSCYIIHKNNIRDFSDCYKCEDMGIDSLININGYYEIDKLFDCYPSRTEIISFLPDGVCIISPSFEAYRKFVKKKDINRYAFDMGLYSVDKDIITVKYFFVGSTTSSCEMMRFKIINPSTIRMIFYGSCLNNPFIKSSACDGYSDARFVSSDLIPDYDNLWIKKYKWFWCDEEKWRQYKMNLEGKK